MNRPETSDEFAARVQRAAGRESDAERRHRESRETDAAIPATTADAAEAELRRLRVEREQILFERDALLGQVARLSQRSVAAITPPPHYRPVATADVVRARSEAITAGMLSRVDTADGTRRRRRRLVQDALYSIALGHCDDPAAIAAVILGAQ